jgi:hypothetical protein
MTTPQLAEKRRQKYAERKARKTRKARPAAASFCGPEWFAQFAAAAVEARRRIEASDRRLKRFSHELAAQYGVKAYPDGSYYKDDSGAFL